MNSNRLSLPKGSLKRAIFWIIAFKLGFVALLRLGVLGHEQTKGVEMQLPLQQVQDALLGQPVQIDHGAINHQSKEIK